MLCIRNGDGVACRLGHAFEPLSVCVQPSPGCNQGCDRLLTTALCFPSVSFLCCSRAVASWMRGRLFRCVLATDHKGAVVGCVTVSPLRAEAALPPPFPSSAPLRCYVSNMAVSTGARRQGVARRLLAQCERIGKRCPPALGSVYPVSCPGLQQWRDSKYQRVVAAAIPACCMISGNALKQSRHTYSTTAQPSCGATTPYGSMSLCSTPGGRRCTRPRGSPW